MQIIAITDKQDPRLKIASNILTHSGYSVLMSGELRTTYTVLYSDPSLWDLSIQSCPYLAPEGAPNVPIRIGIGLLGTYPYRDFQVKLLRIILLYREWIANDGTGKFPWGGTEPAADHKHFVRYRDWLKQAVQVLPGLTPRLYEFRAEI